MRRHSAGLALVVAFLAPLSARADHAVAVLGIEPVDVPEPLAQSLTDALRQRAATTAGVRVVPGKDLVEMKMIFGCDGEQAGCMAQAGKSLGAQKLLFGTIKKAPGKKGDFVVGLKLLDVTSGNVEKFVNETVTKRELAGGNVNAAAAKFFAALIEVEVKPTLTITSDPSNAAVAVDGSPAGRTPITLKDLAPGPHTVALSLLGRTPAMRSVDLKPGGQHEMNVTLEPETGDKPPAPLTPPPPPVTPPPPVATTPPPSTTPPVTQPTGHPGRVAKGIAIGAFAAAVIAGGVAIYTWRSYRDLEDTAHNDLLKLRPQMATSEQAQFFNNPNCNPPASLGSGADVQAYKDHCSSGETFAAATTALWVVAGAMAAGGIVSYVVGDRQAAKAREKAATPSTAKLIQKSLRIEPIFSTREGGLQASFEF